MSRLKTARLTLPTLSVAVVMALATLGYHGMLGRAQLLEAEAEAAVIEADLARLEAERERLANLVARLGPGHLDLDLLDERARRVLGHIRADELIIR
ncbi:MAG: septum formation initiator family protein [Pseudomonadota bacterium]